MGQPTGIPAAPVILINSFPFLGASAISDDLAKLFPSAIVVGFDITQGRRSEDDRDAHRKAILVERVFPEEEASNVVIIVGKLPYMRRVQS